MGETVIADQMARAEFRFDKTGRPQRLIADDEERRRHAGLLQYP